MTGFAPLEAPYYLACLALVMLAWVLFTLAFTVFRPRTPGAAQAAGVAQAAGAPEAPGAAPARRARDRRSMWGVALQSAGYFLMWISFRAPFPSLSRLPGPAAAAVAGLAVALSWAAAAFAFWAQRTLGREWSITARLLEGHRLVTTGPYAVVRHPIYTSMLGLWLATALAVARPFGIVLGIVPMLWGTLLRVGIEDRLLRESFGPRFEDWARRTPAMIPGLAPPLVALATLLAASGAPAAPAPGYEVVATRTLGGEGGWDYLTFDPAGRRLFVSRGTHVMVVDAATGAPTGDLPGTNGVHGIALVPAVGRGFVSDGRDSCVTIFDLASLSVLPERPATGANPDAIVYDPASRRVFTFNGRGRSATAIDAATGRVAGTIPLDGKPEFAVFDGRGRGWVNLEDRSAIVEFDSRALRVLRTFPLAPGEEPTGLALDAAHGRLFAGCGNGKLVVLSTATGKVVAALPIGPGVDGCAYDPGLGLAFASCGGGPGTLSVVREVDPNHFAVAQSLVTAPRARTLALDPATHRVYLVTADFGPAPEPTADQPRPRPPMVPGSFRLLVAAPAAAQGR